MVISLRNCHFSWSGWTWGLGMVVAIDVTLVPSPIAWTSTLGLKVQNVPQRPKDFQSLAWQVKGGVRLSRGRVTGNHEGQSTGTGRWLRGHQKDSSFYWGF
jgi:hypothetical protein